MKTLSKWLLRIGEFVYGYDGKLEKYFEANLTSFTYLFFAETLLVINSTTKLPTLNSLMVGVGYFIFMWASIQTIKPIPSATRYGFVAQILTIALYFLLFFSTLVFPFKK